VQENKTVGNENVLEIVFQVDFSKIKIAIAGPHSYSSPNRQIGELSGKHVRAGEGALVRSPRTRQA
jgi:hypothetical protein